MEKLPLLAMDRRSQITAARTMRDSDGGYDKSDFVGLFPKKRLPANCFETPLDWSDGKNGVNATTFSGRQSQTRVSQALKRSYVRNADS